MAKYFSSKRAYKVLSGQSGLPAEDLPSRVSWPLLPEYAQRWGFLDKPENGLTAFVFVTKGGVLKTSLTLNLARMAAWHGFKTLVIGLDVQCDITRALGGFEESEEGDLDSILAGLDQVQGLYQFFSGSCELENLIRSTDHPYLHFIPETPELAHLEQALHLKARREYWLKENVIDVLQPRYDLILLDGAPNWNLLTTNALVATRSLIAPVECKINNYRNLNMFRAFIQEFKSDMHADFSTTFVPTRYSPQRKLSRDILERYQAELPECLSSYLRESVGGEESMALKLSQCEHKSAGKDAQEMRKVLRQIWEALNPRSHFHSNHQETSYGPQP